MRTRRRPTTRRCSCDPLAFEALSPRPVTFADYSESDAPKPSPGFPCYGYPAFQFSMSDPYPVLPGFPVRSVRRDSNVLATLRERKGYRQESFCDHAFPQVRAWKKSWPEPLRRHPWGPVWTSSRGNLAAGLLCAASRTHLVEVTAGLEIQSAVRRSDGLPWLSGSNHPRVPLKLNLRAYTQVNRGVL